MGFLVVTTGRLLLPADLERQALTVAEHRMGALAGGFDPDGAEHVEALSDLAAFAGVALSRDGEWLTVSTDLRGDPTWSEQAEEFYRSLSGFVQQGEVHLRAQDGSTWSYAYTPDGVERSGTRAPGDQAPPAAAPPAAPPETTEPPQPPQPPGPTEQRDDFIDYPGRSERPEPPSPADDPEGQPGPAPSPYGEEPPAGPPQSYRELRLPDDDDAAPSPPGRALLMTVVLVVGVFLIIGLALLVAGI